MKMTFKRLAAGLLCLLLCVSLLPVSAFAADTEASAEETAFPLTELSEPSELLQDLLSERMEAPEAPEPEHEPTERVRVSILLDDAPVLGAGYEIRGVGTNSAAISYRQSLRRQQDALADKISAQALQGQPLDVVWNLTLAANLISAEVPYGSIEAIRALPEVADVVLEKQYKPAETTVSPNMNRAPGMTGTETVWAEGYTGLGSRVAIIDTGLDTDHELFASEAFLESIKGRSVKLMSNSDVAAVWSQLNASEFLSTADLTYYSEKVPYGANYVDRGTDITHDNDDEGEHGSHVAGIAAANRLVSDYNGGFLSSLETVQTQGQAPDAQLLIMKVFGQNGGCWDSDYLASIEDAVVLGADSINLSLGSSSAGASYSDYCQDVFDMITKHGAVVSISAGNSDAWPAETVTYGSLYAGDVNFHTGGSPGTFTNAFTVASVDNQEISSSTTTLTMSSFSSMGGPGDLSLKPEITAPGGSIYSVDGSISGGRGYEYMSGTSMAAPQIAGLSAVMAQYVKENDLVAKTGLSQRQLIQSLLMSTAEPVYRYEGQYWSLLKQGAGLAKVNEAMRSNTVIMMDASAGPTAADGKVKAEFGEMANNATRTVSFRVTNFGSSPVELELSGDFFTQYIEGGYRYQTTTALPTTLSWTVNGQPLSSGGSGIPDFDGDGSQSLNDAQTLLNYTADPTAPISHLSEADLDSDGDVDTHDAYLAFTNASGGSSVIPAGGSAQVTAYLTPHLPDSQNVNGNYLEGFLYVKESGGVTHSIPVFGFIGNWTDASMFDVGDINVYAAELENRMPYLYYTSGYGYNAQTFLLADSDWDNYPMGGNPLGSDVNSEGVKAYVPEHNAIRSSDRIYSLRFSQIRNSGASRMRILVDGNEKYSDYYGMVDAAYYINWYWGWSSTSYNLDIGYSLSGVSEGSVVEAIYQAAPEYYGRSGSYDWDAMGDGSVMSLRLTVDNTAPQILSCTTSKEGSNTIVHVRAKDNRYLAGVVLSDSDGYMISEKFGLAEAALGAEQRFDVDITDTLTSGDFDGKILVEAVDYARNTASYSLDVSSLLAEASVDEPEALAEPAEEPAEEQDAEEPAEEPVELIAEPADGSLHAYSVQGQAVAPGEEYVVVVTADTACTNGKYRFTFDPEELEYRSVTVFTDYNAANVTEGSCVVSFVSLENVPSGGKLMELRFAESGHGMLSVSPEELNNNHGGVKEELELGHIWGEPVWSWAEDYSSASASFTCKNDASHKQTVNAAVMAGTDASGTTYTATVSLDGKSYTDTRFVPSVSGSGKISAASVSGEPGETVKLELYIEDNPGMAYLLMAVDYDSSVLTLLEANDQGIFTDARFFASSSIDEIPYKLQWTGASNFSADGCFVTLSFRVKDGAPAGDTEVSLTVEQAYNQALAPVTLGTENATVTVTEASTDVLYGDVNSDGVVNGKDAIRLAQYLADWPVEIDMKAADCNGDGVVNGKDAIRLAQYLADWPVTLG